MAGAVDLLISHRPRFGIRLPTALLPLVLAVALSGCRGEAPADTEATESEGVEATGSEDVAVAPEEDALPGTRLPVTYVERSSGFPHDAHPDISCSRCHRSIEGHATHRTIACADCHNVPEPPASGSAPSRAECLGCHHSTARSFTCARCHVTEDLPWYHVSQRLSVATAVQERDLPFDHGRHTAVECRTCHTGGPFLQVERSCASCHENHHRQEAECLVCHADVPLETHDRDAHLTCSGAGCHADAAVPRLEVNRNVCLACHQEQVDHERGRDCAGCHLVGEPQAREGSRPEGERP